MTSKQYHDEQPVYQLDSAYVGDASVAQELTDVESPSPEQASTPFARGTDDAIYDLIELLDF